MTECRITCRDCGFCQLEKGKYVCKFEGDV